MANKNVYFFSIRLKRYSNDTYCNGWILQERFEKIITEHSVVAEDVQYLNQKYKSIDVTENDDSMHSFIEVVLEEDTGAFLRFTRQQPRNNYRGRDYRSYHGNSLLPGNDEKINGIEIGTYAYLNYKTEILEVASVKSAPDEKALAKAFKKYDKDYYVELKAIPNEDSVEELYGATQPYIRRLELELPNPNVGYLSEVLHWDSGRIADLIKEDDVKLSVVLAPSEKGGYIADTVSETKGIIDSIKEAGYRYRRAIIYGKKMGATSDLRKFNFFKSNFGYSISVTEYRKENYRTISYSLHEIMTKYYKEMKKCYSENEQYFKLFLEERDG